MSLSVNFGVKAGSPAAYFANGWTEVSVNTAEGLAKYVDRYQTSPAVWVKKPGTKSQRCKENFVYADWIVVDVDEGVSLDYALKQIAPYHHVIGTTKNHQKPKKSQKDPKTLVVMDRYRFYVKLSRRVSCIHDYEFTGKRWAKLFVADNSVAYAQGMVAPIKIVRCNSFGRTAEPVDGKYMHAQQLKRQLSNQKTMDFHVKEKSMPLWIRSVLKGGCHQRNKTAFYIAVKLFQIGFTYSEIVDAIQRSALTAKGRDHEFTLEEIEKVVLNAEKAKDRKL